ncbi:histidine phosphatase family protein [Paenibacillus sp. Root444D2]|uniref:histidine phosphatase family protein n=1 Tax=Paenibacillus sp. Root444D2 TaxID=1736538 RepID=UPI0007110219|nr:histidine phosphatase family protein [Paenibacillus sp. Root444D2]KQX62677.1 hypothetical protein ASD40_30055 [Paenibacillus sp. Root444D2]
MKLSVTRHGQTEWNAENRVCGVTDIDLTERLIKSLLSTTDLLNKTMVLLKEYLETQWILNTPGNSFQADL